MTSNDVCLYHPFLYIPTAFTQWTFHFNPFNRPESLPKRATAQGWFGESISHRIKSENRTKQRIEITMGTKIKLKHLQFSLPAGENSREGAENTADICKKEY